MLVRGHREIVLVCGGGPETLANELREQSSAHVGLVQLRDETAILLLRNRPEDTESIAALLRDNIQNRNYERRRLLDRSGGTVSERDPAGKSGGFERSCATEPSHLGETRSRKLEVVQFANQLRRWAEPLSRLNGGASVVIQICVRLVRQGIKLVRKQRSSRIEMFLFALCVRCRDPRRPAILHRRERGEKDDEHTADRDQRARAERRGHAVRFYRMDRPPRCASVTTFETTL